MAHDWMFYLIVFLGLWSAVIGGVFTAFSEFIMAALVRSKSETGIEAMQNINITVIPTQFVVGIFAVSITSIWLAVQALTRFEGLTQIALIAASGVYVSTVFLITLLGNVPMNNRLASVDAGSDEGAAYWQIYGRRWTRLNHARSLGSIVTGALYILAAITLANPEQAFL